jgi:hypothetical protein
VGESRSSVGVTARSSDAWRPIWSNRSAAQIVAADLTEAVWTLAPRYDLAYPTGGFGLPVARGRPRGGRLPARIAGRIVGERRALRLRFNRESSAGPCEHGVVYPSAKAADECAGDPLALESRDATACD